LPGAAANTAKIIRRIDISLSNSKVPPPHGACPASRWRSRPSAGYGPQEAGYTGTNKGFNAYAVRTSDALWSASAPPARQKNRRRLSARCTPVSLRHGRPPDSGDRHGSRRSQESEFANEHAEAPAKELSLYKGEAEFPYDRDKWAMAIDLNNATVATLAWSPVSREQHPRGRRTR